MWIGPSISTTSWRSLKSHRSVCNSTTCLFRPPSRWSQQRIFHSTSMSTKVSPIPSRWSSTTSHFPATSNSSGMSRIPASWTHFLFPSKGAKSVLRSWTSMAIRITSNVKLSQQLTSCANKLGIWRRISATMTQDFENRLSQCLMPARLKLWSKIRLLLLSASL